MTATEPATVEQDDTFQRAVDAAMAVLERALGTYTPDRGAVAVAIEAAGEVYDQAQQAQVDDMMRRTGFIGMAAGRDGAAQLRLKWAHDIAAAMVEAFDELIRANGAENYVEWEGTVTDPAREIAVRANSPDTLPPHRQYRFIIVAPGRPSPHELRRTAEAEAEQLRVERDWLLAEADDDTRARYARARDGERRNRGHSD